MNPGIGVTLILKNEALLWRKQSVGWRAMNKRHIAWKYATLFVVALIVLNPEIAELALFIDAIGLEMFLVLLEVQLVTIFSVLFRNKIKSFIVLVRRCFLPCLSLFSWRGTLQNPESLLLVSPSPAVIMQLLVLMAAISVSL
jgi:hypothetical protein